VIDFLDFALKAPASQRDNPTPGYWEHELRLVMKSLMARYFEQQRHYHTFTHIQNGFWTYGQLVGEAMRSTTFFAWAYHDSVYDPHAENNEERSARVFMDDNRIIGFCQEDAARVVDLILSTTHVGETNIVTDIDLAGLGSSLEVYQENTRRIRMEYNFVSDEVWAQGRTAFLKRFIARAEAGKLYHSREFSAAYSARALDNMREEVQSNGYFWLENQ
jgi:predicted metal-dependent HD superfamily phosphohydrolase